MNPKFVKFYRIVFLIFLALFVTFINLGHFYGCEAGACLTAFIIGFNLFWLIFFYILLDMYRGNWGNHSSKIKARGFYWFGWVLIFLGPLVFYFYSWLPLYLDSYDYRENMGRRGAHTLMGIFYQFLGENFGMWLPALLNLAIASLIIWTGLLIIRKTHPFNKELRDSKKRMQDYSRFR